MKHPLISLWFFLGFSISVLMTKSYMGLGLHLGIIVSIAITNRFPLKVIIQRVKLFIFYFPVMLGMYVGFALLLTDTSLFLIVNEAFFGLVKLTLMVGAMIFYLESIPSNDMVTLVRSIWVKINRSWLWVENCLLFLTMTLRFYPTFQSNWTMVKHSRQSLGITIDRSRFAQIRDAVKDMPGLLIHQLRRSEDLATAMKLRGYGKRIPRGVAYPIPFNSIHVFKIAIITMGYWFLHQYGSI